MNTTLHKRTAIYPLPKHTVAASAPADHPDLFPPAPLDPPDEPSVPISPSVVLSLATMSLSTITAPPVSTPTTEMSVPAPEASSAPSAAPDLDDDDLDEIYFPSTEPDPPLVVSQEIRQVNTGWLKPHALSVSVYGGALADEGLVASIRDRGILTTLQVTPDGTVISGHRRLAAAKEALLKTVPVFVIDPKGNRVGDIEEQILEANRQRKKDAEQLIREFLAYKRIETARARERCGFRSDLVPMSAPGDAAPQTGVAPESSRAVREEVGKARDLAAKKVGLAGSTAAVGERVVNVIDRLQNEEKYEDVVRLRIILRDKSIQAACRHAVEKGWLPKPVKRPRKKSGTHHSGDAGHADPAGGDQDEGASGGAGLPAVEHGSDHMSATAADPDTPEVGSDAARAETNVVEVAPEAGTHQPPAPDEGITAERLADLPDSSAQEDTLQSASEATACPASVDPANLASTDPTVFRLADDSEVSIAVAEEGEVIPARKVRQALQAIVPRDGKAPADRQACLRRQLIAVQVSHALNYGAKRFPPARERDLNDDLKYAVHTLQKVKQWR